MLFPSTAQPAMKLCQNLLAAMVKIRHFRSSSFQEWYERLSDWLMAYGNSGLCESLSPGAAGVQCEAIWALSGGSRQRLNIIHLFSGDESGSFKAAEHRNHAHYGNRPYQLSLLSVHPIHHVGTCHTAVRAKQRR